MSRTKKPRKPYRPRETRTDIVPLLFDGDAPVDAGMRTTMLTAIHAAAGSLVKGENLASAWHTVVNALNIAQILCESAGHREVGLQVVYDAQNAMIAAAERRHRSGRLGFAGDELQAMNGGIALFEQMIEVVTKRQYLAASEESVRRIKSGAVVRVEGAGGTKRFQLEAA